MTCPTCKTPMRHCSLESGLHGSRETYQCEHCGRSAIVEVLSPTCSTCGGTFEPSRKKQTECDICDERTTS